MPPITSRADLLTSESVKGSGTLEDPYDLGIDQNIVDLLPTILQTLCELSEDAAPTRYYVRVNGVVFQFEPATRVISIESVDESITTRVNAEEDLLRVQTILKDMSEHTV